MLALVASIGLAPVLAEDAHDELLRRTRFPLRAAGHASTLVEHHPVDDAALRDALEHARSIQPECWQPLDEADRTWMDARSYVLEEDWVPISLMQVRTESEHGPGAVAVEITESFQMDQPRFRQELHKRYQGATFAHRVRARSGDELVSWSFGDGEREATHRRRITSEWGVYGGALFMLYKLDAQLRLLLDESVRQGVLELDEGGLRFGLSLRRPATLSRFETYSLPAGLYEIAGFAECWFEVGDGARLTLLWSDCSGSVICEDRLTWTGEDPLPATYSRTIRLPGSELPVRTERITFASRPLLDTERASIEWSPAPGEQVIDERFGEVLTYQVAENGSIPRDASLYIRTLHDEASSAEVASRSSRETRREPPERSPVSTPWDTIDLGRLAVGTSRRVEFEIHNRGPEPIELGTPKADCGCVDPTIRASYLQPGQSTQLVARLEVTRLGPALTEIVVPILDARDRGGEPAVDITLEAITLSVEVEGTRIPLIHPDPLDLGTFTPAERRTSTIHVIGNGCLADAAPEIATPGLVTRSAWELDEEQGAWRGEVAFTPDPHARPGPNRLLGAHRSTLSVTGPGCPGVAGRTRLLYEMAPAIEGWPACRRLLVGMQTIEIVFPIEVRAPTAPTAPPDLDLEIEDIEGRSRVRIAAKRDVRRTFEIFLESEPGRVRLELIAVPPGDEGDL